MRLRQPFALVGLAAAAGFALTGCTGNALADSCQDYYEFEQEYGPQMQEAMGTTTAAEASDEEMQEVGAVMEDAGAYYREMVDNSDDEAFVAEAEKSMQMFDLFDVLVDPDVSNEEKMETAQSADFNEAIEAEQNIVQMCNEERSS